jgi:hypothetical protein
MARLLSAGGSFLRRFFVHDTACGSLGLKRKANDHEEQNQETCNCRGRRNNHDATGGDQESYKADSEEDEVERCAIS